MNNKSKTIAVLMGGISSEREVSIASGKAIVNALSSLGYNVIEMILVQQILTLILLTLI